MSTLLAAFSGCVVSDGGSVDGGEGGRDASPDGPSRDTSSDAGADARADAPSVEPGDLCAGLVRNDFDNHPRTALDKPAVGEAVTDPAFGTAIRRIASERIPMYSTVSAWNADESLLILYQPGGGHRLYDGRTYEPIGNLDISPSDIEQVYWHTTNPDVLFYPSGNRLVRYHVSGSQAETVQQFDFCGGEASAGGDPFFMSFDSDVIGLKCGNTHFIYRISTDTVTGSQTSNRELAPQAAPSGQRAYWQGDVAALDLSIERSLRLDNPYDHASMGLGADGTDYYLSVVFDGSNIGSLTAHDMTTGTGRVIIGPDTGYPYPPGGTHVSGLAYRNPGWAVVSIIAEGAGSTVLENELVVANFETGDVCRAAHHRSTGDDYWAEPHAVPSPTGTRILFGSDWGRPGDLDAYVLELPSFE